MPVDSRSGRGLVGDCRGIGKFRESECCVGEGLGVNVAAAGSADRVGHLIRRGDGGCKEKQGYGYRFWVISHNIVDCLVVVRDLRPVLQTGRKKDYLRNELPADFCQRGDAQRLDETNQSMVSEPLCPPLPKLPHNGEEDYFLFFTLSVELSVWAHSDAPEGAARCFSRRPAGRKLDPRGAKNRGLLSLMRRHRHHLKPEQHARLSQYLRENPAMEAVYRF